MPSTLTSSSQVVKDYTPLVRSIAFQLSSTLPDFIQLDDIIQSGIIGLVEAYNNYDPSKGAVFATYARIRIRGAMIDELRRGDWAPRSVHRSSRALNQAIHKLESLRGAPCSLHDLALELQLPIDEVSKIIQNTHGKTILSYEDSSLENEQFSSNLFGDSLSPLDSALLSQHKSILSECLRHLPEREKAIVIFHYNCDYSLKQIADLLKISESRISQILSATLLKLRKILDEHQDLYGNIW